MTPYYEADGITIYHGDCREVLPGFGTDTADLVVTDPPYGVSWESNRRVLSFAPIVGDESPVSGDGGLVEAVRVLRGRRHIYVFGRWDLSGLPLGGVVELIWDKVTMGSGNMTSPWGPAHEPIMFGVKANAAQRRGGTGNTPARLRKASVLRYQRPSGAAVTRHPTEKPVGLLRELLESSSRIGELVLDPFMGSGSTLEAARIEGRRAIGVEIDERYCEVAAKRLAAGVLFGAAS